MKITKTTLLFIATLFFLAMPLMFTSGNAFAAAFVHNDGATHNANGGYQLPAGQCTGVATILTSGTQSASVLAGVTTDVDCQAAAVAAGIDSVTDQTTCTNNGLSWSSRHNNCSFGWDTINADTGVLYGSDATISGNQGCLRCHNTDYMTAGNHDLLAAKERYLLTGHRNMLRKVTTAYPQWLNGDTAATVPGGTLPTGSAISLGNVDWTSSNSTVPGFATVSGAAPYTLPAGTLYEWGGWWKNKKIGEFLRETPATDSPSTVAAGGSYTCSQCHTTGWDMLGSSPAQAVQPPTGLINTGGSTWIYEGVQCSRCHDYPATATVDSPATDFASAYNSGHNNGVLPENQLATNLCMQCHTQEQPATDDQENVEIGGHSGYAAAFAGHFRTNQFLNSPHAQFTGTLGQVVDGSAYASKWEAGTCTDSFLTNPTDCANAGETWTKSSTDNNGCVACHDVHISSVDPDVMDPTNTLSNIKAGGTCGVSCHGQSGNYAKNVNYINHPTGTGTPLDGDLSTNKGILKACTTCHMTGSSAGPLSHLFRINADPTYSTFPTSAEYAAGNHYANTAADGSYANAVWMDLDLACGQCHGGSAGPGATNGYAPYFTKDQLAQYAQVMHGGSATSQKLFSWTNDSSQDYVINFAANGQACLNGGCTYNWEFGDGGTGSGPAVSHTYTSANPESVTLTVVGGTGSDTQVVTPLAKLVGPTCGGTLTGQGYTTLTDVSATSSADCVAPWTWDATNGICVLEDATTCANLGDYFNGTVCQVVTANVNGAVSFADGSTAGTGATGVYINWGDGSPMTTNTVSSTSNHSYMNPGSYSVVQIDQDSNGYNCVKKYAIQVTKSNSSGTTEAFSIDATGAGSWATVINDPSTGNPLDPQPGVTYDVMGTNAYGQLVSVAYGTVALGNSAALTLPGGAYRVYLYYPTGHSCSPTSGQMPILTSTGVAITGCQ